MLTTVVTLVYACLCNVALDGVTADSEEKRRSVWHVVGGILYLDVCIHTHTGITTAKHCQQTTTQKGHTNLFTCTTTSKIVGCDNAVGVATRYGRFLLTYSMQQSPS